MHSGNADLDLLLLLLRRQGYGRVNLTQSLPLAGGGPGWKLQVVDRSPIQQGESHRWGCSSSSSSSSTATGMHAQILMHACISDCRHARHCFRNQKICPMCTSALLRAGSPVTSHSWALHSIRPGISCHMCCALPGTASPPRAAR
jgi:hypothetical protein